MEDFYREPIFFAEDFRRDELEQVVLLLAERLKVTIVRENRGRGYELKLEDDE